MTKTRLHHDFETFSEVDLKKAGVSRYARHSSTEALMCAYAFDDGPVNQWVPHEGEPLPAELREAITDPDVVKFAWNAAFERAIWALTLGIDSPPSQWRDPMVLAYALSLPGSLDKAGKVIGLPEDKQKLARGRNLVRRFCVPRRPTKTMPFARHTAATSPAEWSEFKEYNRRDVEAERAIWRRLRRWDLPDEEWGLWALDQQINERGIPVSMPTVRNAIRVARDLISARLAEMKELTGLDNPNSPAQLLPWLRERGYPFDDLVAGHVRQALASADDADADYVRVLELRQETAKASVKKYAALAEATDDDGYLRHTLQFAGAGRTWRWSGRRYQPQNLARPARSLSRMQVEAVRHLRYLDADQIELVYERPMDLLTTCVRPVVQAPPGHVLVIADLNAIENRVLGWMARDDKILNVFRSGRDPYIDFATYMFRTPYDVLYAEYQAGDGSKRTIAKPAVLGCGYMLSPGQERENPQTGEIEATGLLGYARGMNVDLTPEQAEHAVKVWRDTYTAVTDFWWEIDRAAKRCVRTGQPQRCGPVRFDRSGPMLRMVLPSGRALHYVRPRIEPHATPWGEIKPTLVYEGLDLRNQWTRIKTHPGKLTENADQAIARDLLAHGMRLAADAGLDIRMHVHDEIVAVVPETAADDALTVLKQCMSEPPPWASDLPLKTAGFVSPVFIKD